MPLLKRRSDKETKSSDGAESLAVAYEIQRRAGRKRMAHGGVVKKEPEITHPGASAFVKGFKAATGQAPVKKAHGGVVERPESLAAAIMERRRAKSAPEPEELVEGLDDLELEDDLLGDLDEEEAPVVAEDDGDESRVSAIRKRMKAKRGE